MASAPKITIPSIDALDDSFRLHISNLCEPLVIPPLYHYTRTEGLLGILEFSELWATHYSYLNDASEIQYGRSIFEQEVEQLITSQKHSKSLEFLQMLKNLPDHISGGMECYIACFSTEPDLLNQWRDYGIKGGFSLGFEGQSLRTLLNDHEHGRLFKVHYDELGLKKLYRDMIMEFMRDWQQQLPSFAGRKSDLLYEYGWVIADFVTWASLFYKHPAYKIEAEWRYCVLLDQYSEKPNERHFREGNFGLTPYIKCSIADADLRIPFKDIYVGPTVDLINAGHALELLLKKWDYKHVPVKRSTVPVRCS